ncbi:DoxX family protein [Flavobacteriaceae bacterium GSB9]|nr:DoxX family protein [Flavobacteriaceae bacterium GSB9]
MKEKFIFALRVIVALILIQTLRFKFFAHPNSVYIFEKVGLEPQGRIAIGILELIAGILLVFRKTAWIGAFIAIVILGGAILMHLTKLGVEVKGDGGMLFITAIATFSMSVIILNHYKKHIPFKEKPNL